MLGALDDLFWFLMLAVNKRTDSGIFKTTTQFGFVHWTISKSCCKTLLSCLGLFMGSLEPASSLLDLCATRAVWLSLDQRVAEGAEICRGLVESQR